MTSKERFVQINEIIPKSRANGPGLRYTIWFHGCKLNCKGCINPEMHNPLEGRKISINELQSDINNYPEIRGLTLTGGEPVDQIENLIYFLKGIENKQLDFILLTGYTLNELVQNEEFDKLKEFLDVIVSGRYIEDLRVVKGLRGSSNKEYHFLTNRISLDEIENAPIAEILINDNKKMISGSNIDIFME